MDNSWQKIHEDLAAWQEEIAQDRKIATYTLTVGVPFAAAVLAGVGMWTALCPLRERPPPSKSISYVAVPAARP